MPKALTRQLLLALAAAFLLGGCQREPAVHRDRLLVFGTVVEISLYGLEEVAARRALDDLQRQLQAQHRDWHPWQAGSLARVNAALAAGEEIALEPELQTLIDRSQALSRASGGLFNPAIGQLVALWGFHRADEALPQRAPDSAAIQGLLAAAPTMADLTLRDGRLSASNPAVQLDFGASAKGYAIDLALESLRGAGASAAVVNAGGDLRTLGRPGDRLWRIGIRNPRGPGVLASVEVDAGEAVFTSGDYERFFEIGGERFHHILDPRSGRPAAGVSSVTIIHNEAMTADAAATALFIAGPGGWPKVARQMGVSQVMLVDDQGRIFVTPEMARRIRFEGDPAPATEVVSL